MFRSLDEKNVKRDFNKAENDFKLITKEDESVKHAMVVEGDSLTLI